jgi:hypothetical protein
MTDVCIIYHQPNNETDSNVIIHISKTPSQASPQASQHVSPQESPTASQNASPKKNTPRRSRITPCDRDAEQVLWMAKWALMVEAIEKNTRPVKTARLTVVYNCWAILSITLAMFFTMTMTYILWIGFYPPSQVNSPFFIDRLNDFKGFLEGLRDGSIFQGFTDMLAESMVRSLQKELDKRQSENGGTFAPFIPPGIAN